MNDSKLHYTLFALLVGFTLLIWQFSDAVFFWDTVSQASKRGTHFYDTNFADIILSPTLDSGHPTGFNMLVAAIWKVFGRTVEVSHWMMWPFVMGIIYQLYRLVKVLFVSRPVQWLVLLIAVADATFMAQSILISPDLVMLFGFLFVLNAIYRRQYIWVAVGCFLMPFVSIRGILLLAVSGLIWLIWEWQKEHTTKKKSIQKLFLLIRRGLPIFLPVLTVLFAYLTYHYIQTGWWISSPNPRWIAHRQPNDLYNIARNIGLLGWRFLDNGRWISSLLLLYFGWRWWRIGQPKMDIAIRFLLTALISFFLIFGVIFVFFSVAINNRYLVFAFILLHLLVARFILDKTIGWQSPTVGLSLVLLSLLTGSFYVYPKHIAQGWDGTLAHLPYYGLRDQMIEYIDKENIPYDIIGTEFPNIGAFDFYDLSRREEGFSPKDFDSNRYIFYATVMNDFTDEELHELDNEWTVVKSFSQWPIEVILYKRER